MKLHNVKTHVMDLDGKWWPLFTTHFTVREIEKPENTDPEWKQLWGVYAVGPISAGLIQKWPSEHEAKRALMSITQFTIPYDEA